MYSSSLLALAIVLMIICTFIVTIRLVGRQLRRPAARKLGFGADDVFITLSLLVFIGMCINMIVAVECGLWGNEIVQVVPSVDSPWEFDFSQAFAQSTREVLFPLQLAFAKLSILFFYRRVLCTERRGVLYWAITLTMVFTSLWGVAMFFAYLLQCGTSISTYWSTSIILQMEKCVGPQLELFMAGSDCFLDLIIFVLPIPRLSTLHISARRKVLVIGIFITGALSIAASVVRFYIWLASLHAFDPSFSEMNANIILSIIMFWGVFESGFAIIAACLPNIKVVVEDFAKMVKAKLAGIAVWPDSGSAARLRSQRFGSWLPDGASDVSGDTQVETDAVEVLPAEKVSV